MALPATDNFNGIDDEFLSTYNPAWTVVSGQFRILSSAVRPATSATELGAGWNADTFNDDQYSQIVASLVGDQALIGLSVRCSLVAATYYGFYWDDASAYIVKSLNGSAASIPPGGTETPPAAGVVVRLEVTGQVNPVVSVYYDNVLQYSRTDSVDPILSGAAGLSGYSNSLTTLGDDWEGGNLAAPSAPVNYKPMPQKSIRVGTPFGPLDITSYWSGTAPITYASLDLPPGLVISSAGVISGTPT